VDDAFQATFLVLVRKARQLRDPDRLGPWLHGVARRVATKARARSARHRHEPLVDVWVHEESRSEWLDVMPILDAELARLPAKHREVLILCLLDGASPREAAARLGCPVGTVKSRLARAREALQNRLTTRGLAPAVALAVVSKTESFAYPVTPALARRALDLLLGSSISSSISSLATGVLSTMVIKKLLFSSIILGGVAVTGLGTAKWVTSSRAQGPRAAAEKQAQDRHSTVPRDIRRRNMRQILLACHNYLSVNGCFPPIANYGADGLPKLSWRVALLPYLGENELFNQFHHDEPWDSAHNQTLVKKMPAVFQTPDSPAPEGQTRLLGFVGKGAMFEGVRGTRIEEVTDGTSNTALIAMASLPETWTRPADLPFVEGRPLPTLDTSDPHGYALGMADGSVRSFPIDSAAELPGFITRAGGEVVKRPRSWAIPTRTRGHEASPAPAASKTRVTPSASPALLPTAPQPTPMPAPTQVLVVSPGPAPQSQPQGLQALEQRLQRVEEKLDRIIKRLDRVVPDEESRNR
jgi:RNA polymerase sigma factor (sigma-70 family)